MGSKAHAHERQTQISDEERVARIRKLDAKVFGPDWPSFKRRGVHAVIAVRSCAWHAIAGQQHFAADPYDGRSANYDR